MNSKPVPRPVEPLACPVCGEPLAGEGERRGDVALLRCAADHTFDVSRGGYVNLTAGRPPRHPGDTRQQLEARRAVFAAGLYDPLIEAVADGAAAHLDPAGPLAFLDVGCGEGAYTAAVHRRLSTMSNAPVSAFGLDSSKEAARLAARTFDTPRFVVADLTEGLPFLPASLDGLINVFAPRHPAEFARVLRPGGLLLVAIPTPGHLADLRARFDLLDIEPGKERHVEEQLKAAGFALSQRGAVAFDLDLSGVLLGQLVAMTPNFHHLTPEQRAAIAADGLCVRASVTLLFLTHS